MRESVRLGRVLGVPVGLNLSVLVISGLLVWVLAEGQLPQSVPHQPNGAYWVAALVGAVLFLASLLAHEVAHAVVARRNGVLVEGITLWMLGGVTELRGDLPSSSAALRVAAVGPAVSAALAVGFAGVTVAAGLLGAPALAGGVFGWLAVVNGLLAAFNLLPGAPLDGGRVVGALLWRRTGDRVGSAVRAAQLGRNLGVVLVVLGTAEALAFSALSGLWLVLIGWYVVGAAEAEERGVQAEQVLRRITVAEVMTADPPVEPGCETVQELLDHELWRRHADVCLVVDPAGRPEGLLAPAQLAQMRPGVREHVLLEDVVRRAGPVGSARADEPLLDAMRRLGRMPGLVVLDPAGSPVGVLTQQDVERVVRVTALAAP